VIPASRAQAAFDDSTSRLLLLGYQMHGAPEAEWLARAADSLRGVARYGMLGRVEGDAARYAVRDAPPNDPSLQSPSGRILVSGRDAKISVNVYELTTRALVFSGTYRASAESASRRFGAALGYPDRSRELSGIHVTPEEPPSQQGYPELPPLAQALEAAVVEFARSLPGGPTPP
jgi:hypothetical protein